MSSVSSAAAAAAARCGEGGAPGPILLRLPAGELSALLSDGRRGRLEGGRRGLFVAGGGGGGAWPAVVLRGRDGAEGDGDGRVLVAASPAADVGDRALGGAAPADVYVPAGPAGRELRRIGAVVAAALPPRIVAPKASARRGVDGDDDKDGAARLREVGKKLRRRREEERGRRKEIVRIEEDGVVAESAGGGGREASFFPSDGVAAAAERKKSRPPGGAATSAAETRKKRRAPAPRKRPRRPVRSKRAAVYGGGDDNGGPESSDILDLGPPPDVSSLSFSSLPRERRSDTVRVHGLPLGTRPEDVRCLFSGLHPCRVYVLPRHDWEIGGFDAAAAPEGGGSRGEGRHPPTFRAFVQFPSVAVADLAAERSGEVVRAPLPSRSMAESSGGDAAAAPTTVAAAVAVTPVPKAAARFFAFRMAIDGSRGEALRTTADKIEAALRPVVGRALWAAAGRALGRREGIVSSPAPPVAAGDRLLSGADKGADAGNAEESLVFAADDPDDDSGGDPRRRGLLLARRYNALWDVHARLEVEATPLLLREREDGAIPGGGGDDAIARLTAAAGDWFLDEMERTRRALLLLGGDFREGAG